MTTGLQIGDRLHPYGTLEAIRTIEGERYYFFCRNRCKQVAMIPADVFERESEVESER